MPILVTGAAGFIGSHVSRALLNAGHAVVALDDLSGGFRENLPPAATFHQGSILDLPLLTQLFNQYHFDYVFHLAAYAAEGLSHFIRNFNYSNNLLGSINLINLSINHNIKCFVFTSSIAVYGPGQTPMREDMLPTPEDPYGIAKLAVELDLQSAHHLFGLNSIIFRPHNVYGPHQNLADRYRNVIGIFMNQLMSDQPMTIFGDGSQSRAFSYIDDVAPLIANSISNPNAYNHTFNIGADSPTTLLELAQHVARAMNKPANIKHLDARKEVLHAHADHAKLNRIFHPAQPTPLPIGLKHMADWAQKIGPRPPSTFSNIEIAKNLPPSWNTST